MHSLIKIIFYFSELSQNNYNLKIKSNTKLIVAHTAFLLFIKQFILFAELESHRFRAICDYLVTENRELEI